jgi:3-hydroxyacyl-[acyl-carrier-protein] dehydratase
MKMPLIFFRWRKRSSFGDSLAGERVIVRGKKIYLRKGALKVEVSMERENGEVVCTGKLAGMGVDA